MVDAMNVDAFFWGGVGRLLLLLFAEQTVRVPVGRPPRPPPRKAGPHPPPSLRWAGAQGRVLRAGV